MDARSKSGEREQDTDEAGSSQIDARQRHARPSGVPKVSCAVCNRELDEHVATKAESRDHVFYFCGLGCFGDWERARAGH